MVVYKRSRVQKTPSGLRFIEQETSAECVCACIFISIGLKRALRARARAPRPGGRAALFLFGQPKCDFSADGQTRPLFLLTCVSCLDLMVERSVGSACRGIGQQAAESHENANASRRRKGHRQAERVIHRHQTISGRVDPTGAPPSFLRFSALSCMFSFGFYVNADAAHGRVSERTSFSDPILKKSTSVRDNLEAHLAKPRLLHGFIERLPSSDWRNTQPLFLWLYQTASLSSAY